MTTQIFKDQNVKTSPKNQFKGYKEIKIKNNQSKFLSSNESKLSKTLVIINGINDVVLSITRNSKGEVKQTPGAGLAAVTYSEDYAIQRKRDLDIDKLPGTIYHVFHCGSYIGSFSTDDGCGDAYAVNLCGIIEQEEIIQYNHA